MIAVEREGREGSEPEMETSRRTLLWPSLRLRDLPPPHSAST
jgi:hypothetical protein